LNIKGLEGKKKWQYDMSYLQRDRLTWVWEEK